MNINNSFDLYTVAPPPNTADLGTDEKAAVFGNRRYILGVIYNLQNPYLGLGNGRRYWGAGRRYWESYITYKTLIWDLEMGGGIGGEAVLGGRDLGGRLYGFFEASRQCVCANCSRCMLTNELN